MRLPRNVFQLLIILEAAALIAVIIFGAVHTGKNALQAEKPEAAARTEGKADRADREEFTGKKEEKETEGETSGEKEAEGPKELTPAVFSDAVNEKLASMTPEEKAAQLFLITPEALTHSDEVEVAGDSTKESVNAYPVGGLVYFSANFKDSEQTKELLGGVQQYMNERIGLSMFLAVEETGGSEGSPLASANGFDVQPSPGELGAGGDPAAAKAASEGIASYLAEEGFNLNLMPVAELASGEDAAHDGRCYGTDASAVSMMLAESINASKAKGIRTAVGTFPGRGASGISKDDWNSWTEKEGLAFQSAINAGTACIILGNTVCEGLTKDPDALCSLSKEAVYYLRNDMGYQGIIMTASLSEEAVTGKYTSGEAAVEAVKNGVNVIYRPADFEEAYQAVVDASKSGEIPSETLDQAVGYILTQKLG